jgi:capsid protein
MDNLRNRSRDMVHKTPYAANIVDTLVANCVGAGIKPQSKAQDAEFRKQVQALWLTLIRKVILWVKAEHNEQGVAMAGLELGTMQLLYPSEDVKFSESSDVGGNYNAFMRQQLRSKRVWVLPMNSSVVI